MRHKIFLLLLMAVLLCASAGCSDKHAEQSTPAREPQTFGAEDLPSAPQPMGETISQPPLAQSAQEPPHATETASPVDLTEQAIECAVAAVYDDKLTYAPGDPVYFWRALGYLLVRNQEYPLSDGQVTVPANAITPYVTALFGDYPEQYPSLSEEDPRVSEQNGLYTVTTTGPFNHTFSMTEPQPQPDGTYTCRVDVTGSDGPAAYTVTLTDYPAGVSGSELFAYSVAGISEG